MNRNELKKKVRVIVGSLLYKKGYISLVDILMEIGYLTSESYEDWRRGRVSYLEKVCKVNLKKLSIILRELKEYARENDLKSSWTAYNKWGKGKKIRLQFSKSGNEYIEKAYATHYLKSNKK